jgi:hypothetical protein
MSQTVIGFFDDASEAQRAIERLQSSGFNRDRVDISKGGSSSGSGSDTHVNPVSGSSRDENSARKTADDRTVDREGRNTNKITDFFNNLFGGKDDNDEANRYSHVAQKSNCIVTVHAQSKEEAERAADILDDCGAVDVDERASQSGYAGLERSASQRLQESSASRFKSRIVDRPIDEHRRLRDENISGTGTSNSAFGSESRSGGLSDDLSQRGL